MTAVVPSCFLPSVSYFTVILKYESVLIDLHEHYIKQTFRNRSPIFGANGRLDLIVPVQHTGQRSAVKDIRIANDSRWYRIHWKSIETAYRSSPYFEYYEERFSSHFSGKYDFLVELNEAMLNETLKILQIEASRISLTHAYEKQYSAAMDMRNFFSPGKNILPPDSFPPYTQVFSDKHGFIPNLSMLDLLFNIGPQAKDYIAKLHISIGAYLGGV